MLKVFILITGLIAGSALAQDPATAKLKAENYFYGPIGITAALAGPMSTVAGAPYSAQAVTERVQRLADGNRIHEETVNFVARDSQGRVRREEMLPDFKSHPDTPVLVLIEDPVAGVHITLDPRTKTATKLSAFQLKKADEAAFSSGVPPIGGNKTFFVSSAAGPFTAGRDASKTDLGTKTIEGVTAQGTQISRTIPAGTFGNELPMVIATETWYSPELRVLVMSKSSDPRMGETTYKLTNISRAEPDATLFQIPADYAVK